MRYLLPLFFAALLPAQGEIAITFAPPAHLKAGVATPLEAKGEGHAATVEMLLSMTEMDHGEEAVPAAEVKKGTYRSTVKFSMAGAWRIKVHAQANGESATREFHVTVEE